MRIKNVFSDDDEGQFVINVHSVVLEVHRMRSWEVMIFHLQHVLGQLTAIGT